MFHRIQPVFVVPPARRARQPTAPHDQAVAHRTDRGRLAKKPTARRAVDIGRRIGIRLVEMADIDKPLGFKGNYIIFPMKEHCHLTDYMITQFIDEYTNGLKDPDDELDFLKKFETLWQEADKNNGNSEKQALKDKLTNILLKTRRNKDEIIVPTGQLFIEALTSTHPLLEDFKLLHRVEDVRKVRAEVRHAELENLRLAARLLENQNNPKKDNLLEDPDIQKQIIVQGKVGVNVGTNS